MTADPKATFPELREALAKATPGPWEAEEPVGMQHPRIYSVQERRLLVEVGNAENDGEALEREEANGAFIVRAHEDLPDLLAALDAALAENERLREVVGAVMPFVRDRVERLQRDYMPGDTNRQNREAMLARVEALLTPTQEKDSD